MSKKNFLTERNVKEKFLDRAKCQSKISWMLEISKLNFLTVRNVKVKFLDSAKCQSKIS